MKLKKALSKIRLRIRRRPEVVQLLAALRRRDMVKISGCVLKVWPDGYLFERHNNHAAVYLPRHECVWKSIVPGARLDLGDMLLPRELAVAKGLL